MTPVAPIETRIEELITALVRSAPARDPGVVDALVSALREIQTPACGPLALSIARIVELVDEDLIDPGIALPALAMACATLTAGQHGKLGQRELEAARYEIDTLTPLPDLPVGKASPVIPASRLSRGPRPRT